MKIFEKTQENLPLGEFFRMWDKSLEVSTSVKAGQLI